MPRRSGRIFGEDFGEDFRGREAGKKAGAGGTGQAGRGRRDGTGRAAGQDRAGQGGRERAGQSGGGADRSRASVEAGAETGGEENEENGGDAKKRKDWKNWKMLEKTGKSDRGLPGRRSGGTGRERHSAVKPRRYRSLKPSSSTSTGQYSRSSSRRKRTV